MKQFSQQFHKKATSSVKLRVAEKRDLKERLVSYMEYHPLPNELRTKSEEVKARAVPVVSEPFTHIKIPFASIFKYGVGVAVLTLLIVPFAAEKAVPGDTLYAVKVRFNEELRSKLTFDSYQKVEWETERLNRRIAEARLLASEGKLTDEVEAEVAKAVREHTQKAREEIKHLREEDADEAAIASIALDTTLAVQATALRNDLATADKKSVGDGDKENSESTNLITDAIDDSRLHTEDGEVTVPAYDKLMARIEQNTTRIYELRDNLKDLISEDENKEIDRRVADINRSLKEAMAKKVENEAAAREVLVSALQRSQGLVVYMSELEVNNTVDIEELVPVVLTEEEKRAIIASSTKLIQDKANTVTKLLAQLKDENIKEKVVEGNKDLGELLAKMSSSTDNYEAFMDAFKEAGVLADDIIALINRYNALSAEAADEKSEIASTTDLSKEIITGTADKVDQKDGDAIDKDEEANSEDKEESGAGEVKDKNNINDSNNEGLVSSGDFGGLNSTTTDSGLDNLETELDSKETKSGDTNGNGSVDNIW